MPSYLRPFIFLAAPWVAVSPQVALSQSVTGQVRVVDGDTFHFLNGPKIRVFGIDTLEKNQKCQAAKNVCVPCGEQSKQRALELIGKSQVVCELRGEKSYDREVASCSIDGKDYALSMIEGGWALAYRNFLPKKGKGHPYVLAEEKAKAASAGLWSMSFISPGDWRNRKMRLECER